MPRSYGRLLVQMWSPDGDYRLLSWRAQWLYEALLSQPNLSGAGALPMQPNKWVKFAADITVADIDAALAQLVQQCYVLVDDDTQEALIRTFVKHDGGLNNPKTRKGIESAILRIESSKLRAAATDGLRLAIDQQSNADRLPEPDDDHLNRPPAVEAQVERQSIANRSPFDRQSILPATCNLQPATTKAAAADTHVGCAAAPAAAALEIFIQHRTSQTGPHNPAGFARSLRRTEPSPERTSALAAYLEQNPTASAVDIAYHVYGISRSDLHALGYEPPRRAS